MSYSRIADHCNMVLDDRRNQAYDRALRDSLKAGSVVLDLGAGLGIHGLLAAAAGAAKVYLVEPQPVAQLAAAAARANGFGDRVVVVQQRIEDTQLPEQVDAIVSVFTGNLLFSEDLLPSLFTARDRYLKPGGILVPDFAQLALAPVSAPRLHRQHVARWSEPVMGLNYAMVRSIAANEIVGIRREELHDAQLLGAEVAAAEVDLMRAQTADCAGKAVCAVHTSGLCHGLVGSIRIRLAGQWLSTGPGAPDVHWVPMYLPVDPPLALQAGEDLTISIVRPSLGDWAWTLNAKAGERRHSTFLAGVEGPSDWRRAAPGGAPGLGPRGRRARLILDGLARGATIALIAEELGKTEALSKAEALREVQAMALRYGGNP